MQVTLDMAREPECFFLSFSLAQTSSSTTAVSTTTTPNTHIDSSSRHSSRLWML